MLRLERRKGKEHTDFRKRIPRRSDQAVRRNRSGKCGETAWSPILHVGRMAAIPIKIRKPGVGRQRARAGSRGREGSAYSGNGEGERGAGPRQRDISRDAWFFAKNRKK